MIKYNKLIIFLLLITSMYIIYDNHCYKKKLEKMSDISDSSIKNKLKDLFENKIDDKIKEIYNSDVSDINNLTDVSTKLQEGTLTVSGNLIINNKVIMKGTNKNWIISINRSDNYLYIAPSKGNNYKWNWNNEFRFNLDGKFKCKQNINVNNLLISEKKITQVFGPTGNRTKDDKPSWYNTQIEHCNEITEMKVSKTLGISGELYYVLLQTYKNNIGTSYKITQIAYLNNSIAYRTSKSDTEWNEWFKIGDKITTQNIKILHATDDTKLPCDISVNSNTSKTIVSGIKFSFGDNYCLMGVDNGSNGNCNFYTNKNYFHFNKPLYSYYNKEYLKVISNKDSDYSIKKSKGGYMTYCMDGDSSRCVNHKGWVEFNNDKSSNKTSVTLVMD